MGTRRFWYEDTEVRCNRFVLNDLAHTCEGSEIESVIVFKVELGEI